MPQSSLWGHSCCQSSLTVATPARRHMTKRNFTDANVASRIAPHVQSNHDAIWAGINTERQAHSAEHVRAPLHVVCLQVMLLAADYLVNLYSVVHYVAVTAVAELSSKPRQQQTHLCHQDISNHSFDSSGLQQCQGARHHDVRVCCDSAESLMCV
jgi:hypothetical protein